MQGIYGAWTALSCARAGHSVTLLDQRGPANNESSSAGESLIIRSAYGSDEVYTRMAQRSLYGWKKFLREENRGGCFRQTGVLWMANMAEPSIWQAQAIFNQLGITYDWLDARGISERYPQFKVSDDAVAIFEPEGGALLADQCVEAIMVAAFRAGVRYELAEVKPPVFDDAYLTSVVTTDGQHFAADCFLFACGSWLPRLFEVLRDVIRPTRQDVFFFDIPENSAAFRPPAFPIWIDQTDSNIGYGFPDLGSGLKVGFHRLGPLFDPDLPREKTGTHEASEMREYLETRFPELSSAVLRKTQVCHYENTQNGDFLIDRHPDVNNVWLIGGGSGHGFKHGPAVADYVIGVLDGTETPEPRFGFGTKYNDAGKRVL